MAIFGSRCRGVIVAVCSVLLAGCGGGSGGDDVVTDTGFVRIVNSVGDGPTLSVGVGALVAGRVSFAQSTRLTQIPAGNYALNVQYVTPAGAAVNVISNEPLTLAADVEVSVFVVGDLATAHSKLVTNPLPVIAAGKAEFQVVHAASNVGTVDVYLTLATALWPAGAVPLPALAFEAASDLQTIDAGTYRLRVTSPGNAADLLYDSGPFAIESESRPMFVLEDYFPPGAVGTEFRVVQLSNEAATTFPAEVLPGQMRIANMIADQTAVDVYVGGALTFPGVAFGTIAARQQFAAGDLDIAVTPAGSLTALLTGTVGLNPGESRTLVVSHSGSTVAARFSLDNTRPISVATQLQVVQATPSSGNIDLYLLSGTEAVANVSPDFANLPLLSIASGSPAADTYTVAVTTPTGSKTVAAGPVSAPMDNDGIYSIYVSDSTGGVAPPEIVLGDDFN